MSNIVTGPNGHSYFFSTVPTTWSAAEHACAVSTNPGFPYHIVSIRDAAENAWVFQQEQMQMPPGGNWWLGYNDRGSEGTWVWDDHMGQGYVNWNNGEPNNQGDEDCLMHASQIGGKWNDSNCNNQFRYVCENGGVETPLTPFWFQLSNTNNDTQNYAQFAVDLTFGHNANFTTCGTNTGDTYMRVIRPNGSQIAENNDGCGQAMGSSDINFAVPQTGTYVLRGGCGGSSTCSGTPSIFK